MPPSAQPAAERRGGQADGVGARADGERRGGAQSAEACARARRLTAPSLPRLSFSARTDAMKLALRLLRVALFNVSVASHSRKLFSDEACTADADQPS
eukprot:6201294-Pleurochrysis_carterae.AAC.2